MHKHPLEVAIIGAGYVGLTTATLLANSGVSTSLIDVEPSKIETIKSGKSPFFEPDLDTLIADAIANGLLKPTTSYEESIPKADVIFCCVGTPDRADGSSNLDYVFKAIETAAELAKDGVIMVQKSTVPVGTGKKLTARIEKIAPNLEFYYVSNPEFLREGSAIRDTLYPDRTVVGGDHRPSLDKIASLYQAIAEAAPQIDPVLQNSYQKPDEHNHDFVFTTLESAELIKVTANAFLALKISFANSIAKLCDSVGADVNEVMDGIGKDRRIGRAFLNASRGYGGGCFPKDVSGLIASANEYGVDLEIMEAAVIVNASMPEYIVQKIQSVKKLKGAKVALLGLSFKAATSDTRRSPGIALGNLLIKHGAKVRAYDPQAIIEDTKLDSRAERFDTAEEALRGADIMLLATEWPEFIALDFDRVKEWMQGDLVIDGMNVLPRNEVEDAGLRYLGVGR